MAQVYKENFFAAIAKLLLKPKIQSDLEKAEKMLEDDPELLSTVQNLKKNYQKLQIVLPDYCKKYPDSPACKALDRENSK